MKEIGLCVLFPIPIMEPGSHEDLLDLAAVVIRLSLKSLLYRLRPVGMFFHGFDSIEGKKPTQIVLLVIFL